MLASELASKPFEARTTAMYISPNTSGIAVRDHRVSLNNSSTLDEHNDAYDYIFSRGSEEVMSPDVFLSSLAAQALRSIHERKRSAAVVALDGEHAIRCLFGAGDKGVVHLFFHSTNFSAFDLSIYQIYEEEAIDLLIPDRKLRWEQERPASRHYATTGQAAAQLVNDALAMRAALQASGSDTFQHCAHLYVECAFQSFEDSQEDLCLTFLAVGAPVLRSMGFLPESNGTDLEVSLHALQNKLLSSSSNDGETFATNKLSTLLEKILSRNVSSIWVACLSSNTDSMHISRLVSRSKQSFSEQENRTITDWSHFGTKLRATSDAASDRNAWMKKRGLEVMVNTQNDAWLIYVSRDTASTRRIGLRLNDDKMTIGSRDTCDVLLEHFAVLPEHCDLTFEKASQNSEDAMVTLEIRAGALVSVNGKRISVTTKLKHGDTLLLGYNLLFELNLPISKVETSDRLLLCPPYDDEGLWLESVRKLCLESATVELNRLAKDRSFEAWERLEFESEYARIACLCAEANAAADELQKNVTFHLEARSAPIGEKPNLVVVAACSEYESDDSWTETKLVERISRIRTMVMTARKFGHNQLRADYNDKRDAFYDPPDHRLIGVGFLFIDAVSYLLDINETIPIVDFKGDQAGELILRLTPSVKLMDASGVQQDPEDELDAIEPPFDTKEANLENFMGQILSAQVHVHAARGLPARLCANVFVRFHWFLQRQPFETARSSLDSVNPRFDQVFSPAQVITYDFLRYCADAALEFEVWGQSVARSKAIRKKYATAPPPENPSTIDLRAAAEQPAYGFDVDKSKKNNTMTKINDEKKSCDTSSIQSMDNRKKKLISSTNIVLDN